MTAPRSRRSRARRFTNYTRFSLYSLAFPLVAINFAYTWGFGDGISFTSRATHGGVDATGEPTCFAEEASAGGQTWPKIAKLNHAPEHTSLLRVRPTAAAKGCPFGSRSRPLGTGTGHATSATSRTPFVAPSGSNKRHSPHSAARPDKVSQGRPQKLGLADTGLRMSERCGLSTWGKSRDAGRSGGSAAGRPCSSQLWPSRRLTAPSAAAPL